MGVQAHVSWQMVLRCLLWCAKSWETYGDGL